MNEKIVLSIIVPVYNVSKYLTRCIDSLLDQNTTLKYEIILVDDGSTDDSPTICDQYQTNVDKIIVLHKSNGGLSSARNAGIRASSGEFLMFVDSDDYIKSNSLNEICNNILENNPDVYIYNFSYIYDGYKVINNPHSVCCRRKIVSGDDYMLYHLERKTMMMMAWNKICKKALIIQNNVFFREGYLHEDEEWSPRILHISKRILFTDSIIYGYYMREGSICNTGKYEHNCNDMLSNCERLKEYVKSFDNIYLKKLLEDNIATLAMSSLYKARLKDKKQIVLSLCNSLKLSGKNKVKIKLLKVNIYLYFYINDLVKYLLHKYILVIKIIKSGALFYNYLCNKIRKIIRMSTIARRQKRLLQNHNFSIISSTCNGGVITSELGEKFRTPTINLWLSAGDFVKMAKNLKYYMSLPVKEVKNNFCSYPVGKIGDITLNFVHYHSFDEAVYKWNERKTRINYNNIYLLMAERDGCNEDIIKNFNFLPYKNKIIFTAKEYPKYKSTLCVKKYASDGQVSIMTDFTTLGNRKYDEYFDYVTWLNNNLAVDKQNE